MLSFLLALALANFFTITGVLAFRTYSSLLNKVKLKKVSLLTSTLICGQQLAMILAYHVTPHYIQHFADYLLLAILLLTLLIISTWNKVFAPSW